VTNLSPFFLVLALPISLPACVGVDSACDPSCSDETVADAGIPGGGVKDGGVIADGGKDSEPTPLNDLDDVTLHLNLGDSFGAGYNAGSGRGYAPIVHHNHDAYPAYASHNIKARFAGASFVNRAESGATSAGVVGQAGSLPESGDGDVVVTIYTGGNDFNDEISVMLFPAATEAAINQWRSNLTEVLGRLRAAYDDPGAGRNLIVVIATIHDPTGGTGSIPPEFDDGFCGTIQQVPAGLGATAVANLGTFNDAIRQFAIDEGATLLDANALFLDHGMNAPGDARWIDTDCAHGTNEGHHQVRKEIWRLLTGDTF